jgi:hypothetical protein
MPDARKLDDAVVSPLLPAASDASAATTASGNWVDCSNYVGDLLVVINVGSVTGTLGSLAVQLQSAAANTGASAANEAADPRSAGLATITAVGTYTIVYAANYLANKFVGVSCSYTGITAAVMSVELIGRPKIH